MVFQAAEERNREAQDRLALEVWKGGANSPAHFVGFHVLLIYFVGRG